MGIAKVGRLREKLAAPILVRGTSSHFPIAEQEAGRLRGYQAYYVAPRSNLSDRVFFEKFHATLSAAVDRALQHSILHPKVQGKPETYPELRFAIPTNEMSLNKYAALCRVIGLAKDRQTRPYFEEALVRGKLRQTFQETTTSPQLTRTWFRVRLTKQERHKIRATAKRIAELCASRLRDEPSSLKDWQSSPHVKRILRENGYPVPEHFPLETSAFAKDTPHNYVFYEEARKILVAKALKQLEQRIEKIRD